MSEAGIHEDGVEVAEPETGLEEDGHTADFEALVPETTDEEGEEFTDEEEEPEEDVDVTESVLL